MYLTAGMKIDVSKEPVRIIIGGFLENFIVNLISVGNSEQF